MGTESALNQHKKKCPIILRRSRENFHNAKMAVALGENDGSEERERKRPRSMVASVCP
jgi:hypothetical protein